MKDKIRKCVGCQTLKNRNEMYRVLQKYDTEEFVVKPDNKTFGRSFYICKDSKCIDLAFKKNKKLKGLNKDLQENLKEILQKNLII